jgi:MtrB/PioB family decaheme-associated outer membrane protein
MITTSRRLFRSGSLLLALTGLPAFALAQESPPQTWTCERCLEADGWEWDIEGGPAYLSNDAFRYGDYTGLDEKGLYLFGDVFGRYWGEDASYMVIEGYARGIDSSALFFKGGKQSLYEVRASYQAIPRRFFDTTVTPYSGGANLTLPTNWVRAPSTQQMTELDSASLPVSIGWDWDILGLGVDYRPARNWKVSADYTRREREGLQRISGSFLFNAAEFAAPIDYTTDDLEVAVSYAADTWQASATYFGSVFSNANDGLNWDNAYSSPAGVDAGQLALPPDNSSHQLSLAASMLLPARTTLNGQLSFGKMSQNEALLPYTMNPSLATTPLPAGSANAKVSTLNLNVRATSSPWRRVTLEGEIRYNDFDNKTPVNAYDYIVTDSAPAPGQVLNSAYNYKRRVIKLRGEYRLRSGMKLYAGFDNERFERNRQDRKDTTTNRLWFTLRTRLGDIADLHANIFADDRDGSSYQAVDNPLAPENPLMRKYNMADRQRSGARLHGSVYASQRMDFGWELEFGSDDYNNSTMGLTNSDYLRFGADFSYLFDDAASLYASLYQEDITTEQQNSQSFSVPDWSATTDDSFTTATLGIVYPGLLGRLDANLEFGWADSKGESKSNTSGLPTSFPDLRSNRQNFNLGLSYPYNDSLTFRFDYIFESLDSDDWALDGVNPDTIPNLLALGADAWNYDANVFYFSARWVVK